MVSASTSVNAGVGPRLRRRVSPRICRTASSITQYSQTKRSSRSMDGPPQGSGALKTVPHRPIPRGSLFEVTHSASLNRGKPEVRVYLDSFYVPSAPEGLALREPADRWGRTEQPWGRNGQAVE